MADTSELAQLRRERDLYLRLLSLGHQDEPATFLEDALALMVELTSAAQGYLELHDRDDRPGAPRWSIARGFSANQVSSVREAISRGIISEAIATGQTIITGSAHEDPRFSGLESVRLGKFAAVICAPVGQDRPRGVVYLCRGAAGGPFSEDDRGRVEMLAHHLAPLADRLILQQRAHADADPTAPWRAKLRLDDVIGRSPAFAAALKQAANVAPLDVAVLLTGESGTGKSQLARIIHDSGPRANQAFVELNCAALPAELVESELFGALPGAHSTATRPIEGKVHAAEGGTLLLDEIGEVPHAVQAKLLQLLQSKLYYPLGGAKPVQADVRVIAATNADLQRAVAERRFREDLFYRLQVVPIRVPSLAERSEDVQQLAAFFCSAACERHRLPRLQLSPNALRAVQAAEWPGNVRQLAHAVEAAVIRATGDRVLRVEREHVFTTAPPTPTAGPHPLTFQQATRSFQEDLLQQVLRDTEWNVSETARRLDLTRTHIYNLIRAFGLERERH
jgi:Nif-specific regulatory protein